jgi:hypothetical protein
VLAEDAIKSAIDDFRHKQAARRAMMQKGKEEAEVVAPHAEG